MSRASAADPRLRTRPELDDDVGLEYAYDDDPDIGPEGYGRTGRGLDRAALASDFDDDDDFDTEIDNPILAFTRLLWPIVFVLAVLAGVFFVAYPAGRLVAQQENLDVQSERLAQLEEANAELDDRMLELGLPREVQRLARERYGAVQEGWEVYQLQPEPVAQDQLPDTWPFDQLDGADPGDDGEATDS